MPAADFHLLENEEDLARRLDDYVKAEVLALDIETTGLDPYTHRIRLVQIAAQGLPVLIVDLFKCRHGLSALTPLLVNESVKVMVTTVTLPLRSRLGRTQAHTGCCGVVFGATLLATCG